MRSLIAVFLLAVAATAPSAGMERPSPQVCNAENDQLIDVAHAVRLFAEPKLRANAADVAADVAATTPLGAPSAIEATAPSSSSSADSPVDKAEIPWLAAFGIGSDLVNREGGVVNVNLNPFGFLQALNPRYQQDDNLYQRTRNWRRWGGSLALGGTGEELDRDGDGTNDAGLEADDLTDIVDWEIQYRLRGTRDRREQMATFLASPASDTIVAAAEANLNGLLDCYSGLDLGADTTCYDKTAVLAYISAPEQEAAAATCKEAISLGNAAVALLAAKFREIDRSPVVTLVAGGTSRNEGFGRDSYKAALRAAGSRSGFDNPGTHNFNLEWSRLEGLADDPNQETFKAGYEYSRLVLRGTSLSKDGVPLSGSGVYEKFRHVPDADHDSNAILNAKIDFPISAAISIPLSITWANHADLITDEDELRGHVGFSIDLSKIKEELRSRL